MYLNTHSSFSLRYGTMAVKTLLETAQKYGVKHMALTDINMTAGCIEYAKKAQQYDVTPVLGVDFREGAKQCYIMLAQSERGYQLINEHLSAILHDQKRVESIAPQLEDTVVVYPYHPGAHIDLKANEYVGVSLGDLSKLRFQKEQYDESKLVALHTVSFPNKSGYNVHRLLRAIDENTLLSKMTSDKEGKEYHQFLTLESLEETYCEFPHLLTNTQQLLEACVFDFNIKEGEPNNQKSYTNDEALDFRLLRKLSYEGIPYRYKELTETISKRIEQELSIIKQKGFVSYFLINWKILKYARSKGYYYVGRGSGANSVIAYLLRITDVDPVELDLYFERFINLYRKNPPDFDIDFSWADRDDVTAYIFKRFKHVALVTVYNTFQYKAAIRELGKVLGVPNHEIEVLTSGRYDYRKLDSLSQLLVTYAKKIEGMPNYLGIHAGGVLISEKPIQAYAATFLPPKGFSTTHLDMIVAEDVGLYKFDILSQRGLGKIKDAVSIVKENVGVEVDVHDFERFKKDERVKYLLKNAKAIGCFYVESPAMRMLLKKLEVDNYLGLVAASSIIRPGVAKSGMMREYILRYRNPEKRKEAHPVMQDIMPETYGIMVYQEDVIKVAHYFGGLSLGEADMLRRGMSGKFRSRDEFAKVKGQFFENCKNKGYSHSLVLEVWRQIESFAGYAFAKGHSASYAVESYQSLFLKAYYPLEYMVATINNSGGFYRVDVYIHEARMNGANVHAPCVNKSFVLTSINGNDIHLGFHLVKSLEHKLANKIVLERSSKGVYESLDDFIQRVSITLEQLVILIKVNAFDFTGKSKRELLWEAYMKVNGVSFDEENPMLFQPEGKRFELPSLNASEGEHAFDELEHLGFTLRSPFSLLKDYEHLSMTAKKLQKHVGSVVEIDAYLVTVKNTTTSTGKRMCFGTFLDQAGDFVDTTHFPNTVALFPFRGPGVYRIEGKVVEEFGSISIETRSMVRMPMMEDPRYAA